MLQYPINVYPDNVTIDTDSDENDKDVHFTFKGDILRACVVRFFDYNTGNVVVNDSPIYTYDSEMMVFEPIAYNNENLDMAGLLSSLPRIGSYIVQFLLIEGTQSDSGVIANKFALRGSIQEDYTAGSNTVLIEDRINNIYEWSLRPDGIRSPVTVEESGRTYSLDAAFLKIGNYSIRISSYNYLTGELVLENSIPEDLSEGTSYQIYCNYLISQQYYFKLGSMPSIVSLNATFNVYGMKFQARYNQLENVPLKYYNITVQKKSSSGIYYTIAQTENIYSQKIEYDFVDDYDIDGVGGNDETRKYRFIVNAVSQDNMSVSQASQDFTMPEREAVTCITDITAQSYKHNNVVHIDWDTPQAYMDRNFRIYRLDGKNYSVEPNKILIGDTSVDAFDDYTASTHGSYKYMIVPYYDGDLDNTEIDEAAITEVITTDEYGYTITAIVDTGKEVNGKPFYIIGDTWKFIADIENTTVTQNTDKTLHVGNGRYSSLTATNVNYMSGTVSAMLGIVSCVGKRYTDNIEVVRAWRNFIAQKCQYILKSQKGDVWIVNITDNPTTEYQEDSPYLETKFSFNWAECCSVEDIVTGTSLPFRAKDREW